VDLSPRSRSACSNRRMRARTDMGGRLARAAAPALEQPAERGRQVVGLEVAPRELVDQDLDAVARREVAVGEDDVLAVEPAPAAAQYALWLAERWRATVTGLHVIDIVSIEGSFFHDVSGSLGFEPYLDFSSKMREALQERGRVLLDAFAERCRERNVPCDTTLP